MSRITDTLLGNKAFGANTTNPMLDPGLGGQHGWAPDLTGWLGNQPYVRENIICVVLEVPRFFELMPNPEIWTRALQSIMEKHTVSIDGLNATLEVEFEQVTSGGAGEKFDVPSNVTRTPSEPVHSVPDKYGRSISTLISNWITIGLMDPDTKFPLISTYENVPEDFLADWRSMSCLYYEPDPTNTKVVQSWVCTNMMPKTAGDIVGKRDLTAAKEINTIDLGFTALSQYNLGTNVYAQSILDEINSLNSNPNLRPSFIQEIAADVKASSGGYKESVEKLGREAVTV